MPEAHGPAGLEQRNEKAQSRNTCAERRHPVQAAEWTPARGLAPLAGVTDCGAAPPVRLLSLRHPGGASQEATSGVHLSASAELVLNLRCQVEVLHHNALFGSCQSVLRFLTSRASGPLVRPRDDLGGAIAQLGERYNGIVEVSGSIPLGSTIRLR